jgi:hypothetical protein
MALPDNVEAKEPEFWARHKELNANLLRQHLADEANDLLIERSEVMYKLGDKAQDLSIQIAVLNCVAERLAAYKESNPGKDVIKGQQINTYLSNYNTLQRDEEEGMCRSFRTLLDARETMVLDKKIVRVSEKFKEIMVRDVLLPKIQSYSLDAEIKNFFRKRKGPVDLNKKVKISKLENYIEEKLAKLREEQYAVMDEQEEEGFQIEDRLSEIPRAAQIVEQEAETSFNKVIINGDIFEISAILAADPEKANEEILGRTPLHWALYTERYLIAILLLAFGARNEHKEGVAQPQQLSRSSSTSEREGKDSDSENDGAESLNSSSSSATGSLIEEVMLPSTHLMMQEFYEGKVREQKAETPQGKALSSWNLLEAFYDLNKNDLLRAYYLNRLEQNITEGDNDPTEVINLMSVDFHTELESKLPGSELETIARLFKTFLATLASHASTLDLTTLKNHVERSAEYAREIKEKVSEQTFLLDIASNEAGQAFFTVACTLSSAEEYEEIQAGRIEAPQLIEVSF